MTQPLVFTIGIYHNRYLPGGHRVMHAVLSITATGDAVSGGLAPTAAQVIMIDCSGSMGGEKITEARLATTTAVDLLRDEVAFAVVAGTTTARMVYPPTETMVPASKVTRAEARTAIKGLTANGGTAIGTWLELANRLLDGQTEEIKHGILLTDGHNVHQKPHELAATLQRCRGRFGCDVRGVGRDWSAGTLREIADALLGTADGLPSASALNEEFQAMTEAIMGKAAADLILRVRHSRGARVVFLKQVHPYVHDLTDRRLGGDELHDDYPTGSWGAETRDYHLAVELPPETRIGDEVLAAHVELADGDTVLADGLIPAIWTDDVALSTKINDRVAHYTDQVELDTAAQEGFAALRTGDHETATAKLGTAVRLAAESERSDTLRLLAQVVDVIDAPAGTVRLRPDVDQVDAEMAQVRSRKTVRWRAR